MLYGITDPTGDPDYREPREPDDGDGYGSLEHCTIQRKREVEEMIRKFFKEGNNA